MRKSVAFFTSLVFTFLIFTFAVPPMEAHAVPAFARQTGFSCNTCHFQHFPSLNQFGREFKAGGYTMVGGQSLVEGDFLSLPSVLNATLVVKLRYQKTNGPVEIDDARNRGKLEFPNEGALILGGRAGEHVGFLLEAQLVDGEGSNFASFKMPVVYDIKGTKVSLIPFTTDAAGAAYGFELLNTGAMRLQRPLEHRSDISAQQYIGTATEATGGSLVLHNNRGYLSYTAWSPEHQVTDASPYLHYLRAVLTHNAGGFDLAVGGQIWDGETRFTEDSTTTSVCVNDVTPIAPCDGAGPIAMGDIVETTVTALTKVAAEAWAVDAQAQGKVAGLPLGVYLSYAEAARSDMGAMNLFNSSTVNKKKAFAAIAELGVRPEKLTVSVGHRDGETGAATMNNEDSTTVAASYLLTQNVRLQAAHTWYDNDVDPEWGDKLATLMVFAAF